MRELLWGKLLNTLERQRNELEQMKRHTMFLGRHYHKEVNSEVIGKYKATQIILKIVLFFLELDKSW